MVTVTVVDLCTIFGTRELSLYDHYLRWLDTKLFVRSTKLTYEFTPLVTRFSHVVRPSCRGDFCSIILFL